jgi:hypothetical protein
MIHGILDKHANGGENKPVFFMFMAISGYLSQEAFSNVYKRLRVVLVCIVDDNGGNRLVESKRGKLFRDATIIDLKETYNVGYFIVNIVNGRVLFRFFPYFQCLRITFKYPLNDTFGQSWDWIL